MSGTVKSPSPRANCVTARKGPGNVKRLPKDVRGGQAKHAKHVAAKVAAAKAREVLPGFATVGELSVLVFPSPAGTIPYALMNKRVGGLPSAATESLLLTLAAFAASGVAFSELSITHPLSVLIVSTRDGVSANLADICSRAALFPRERITVHQIHYDNFGQLVVGDVGRLCRVVRPSIILWLGCSLGTREAVMPFVGDISAAHIICTDVRPIPVPIQRMANGEARTVEEVQTIFTLKGRTGRRMIVDDDRKTHAVFTVAADGRIEPIQSETKFNLRSRLSAAHDIEPTTGEVESGTNEGAAHD